MPVVNDYRDYSGLKQRTGRRWRAWAEVVNDYRDYSGLKTIESVDVERRSPLVVNDYRDYSGLKPWQEHCFWLYSECGRKRLPPLQRIETRIAEALYWGAANEGS